MNLTSLIKSWLKTFFSIIANILFIRDVNKNVSQIIPKSVNYHFTRRCNYSCGFCFHTAKTSYVLPLDEAKRGLKMLRDAGMEKLNFSGGEPFLENRGRYVGELTKYAKEILNLPSVSIVSNGSLLNESWFQNYGTYLDILAISCDSFNEDTNKSIGRGQGNKNHVEKLLKIHSWCEKYRVLFKINTVVNTFNVDEDMSEKIQILNPIRWKINPVPPFRWSVIRTSDTYNSRDICASILNSALYQRNHCKTIINDPNRDEVFQCLLLDGENVGPDALRNAEQFYITDQQFDQFLDRHRNVKCLVPESNVKMQNSYLILDEYMRFLDCRDGTKKPSKSILDIGVANALDFSGFDEVMFRKRGGVYKWSKTDLLDW